MTLIFKVNRQGQNIHFRFFDISDPKNVRIDTKIKSVPRLQPEITKVIQKGVWPWFSRSCNEDRIFSLSPLDSLTPKTYPYVIFSKNSYGKTKIQGGVVPTPPLGVRRWIFTLGVRGLIGKIQTANTEQIPSSIINSGPHTATTNLLRL